MKTKKLTSILILGGAVLAGFFLLSRKGDVSPASESAILLGTTVGSFAETLPLFDFGSVSMGKGMVRHDFALTNNTVSDIAVERAETSCMCTEAILALPDGKELGPFGMPGHGLLPRINAVVRPGETLTVRVVFDPAAHGPSGIGLVERQVLLGTSQGVRMMAFRANVTP
ncbi:MAG: hypothetical protein A3A43_00270 [Candidatus Liptonbacteria bacterium RIFCSPLOWO2_01_FULL_56_20]|uniref:DUF1573 domain-containing protein n=1 Tax=Candidatus Liptonbacteria bacterium RIFCSPLOWO2_01_FULL_56_20 TaxID=1798652 RepID=A0A1G2CI55_9BACT|nr:MAG: hypothetical protein UY96_C0011G0022 [Parcubacteria group bacterium GW2011_GWB1_56_8]OGY98106.1 MAG: hypothetical protein A2681_02655 [Candidatus Liptonbacteria bacterium RIFCSPHIGHO2_01_FULL_56_18b]OGZ01066.1 MAG: hypothetical protein A3A43_00270 [Candidatus Liptonbacteria bacterium RIFCSPLOWO2_01_FULL_56_20]